MSTLWKILTRRKILDPAKNEESSLARVLNTFDLTALGVGSTLGVGMYVLVGKVAKETAGPSVVLSFLIAAIASAFAGLCYAEFGARTPRAGSAYIYSYVCVGEFIAFVIGWNLVLEYIIGSASVARGMSLYIDSLLHNKLRDFFLDIAPINISFLSPYFDFLSFGIAMVLSIGLAFGMKESSKANNVFTCLNVLVVLFVIIAGSTKADPKNWDLVPPANVTNAGKGGFFPFGISGTIKGAATCFYGFVGFDCIATTGEEVKNPQKAIPFAIIISLGIVFVAYCSTATVVTLMVPYYLQDVRAPIPHAFEEFGWEYAKWIVTIGGIFALFASLFGAMFPLPRILYAMASDGLVFKFLGKVSARFSTPVAGTLLAGLFTGLMSGLFEQGVLVDMMSIGTLLAYTIVAACVLLLRYAVDEEYTLVRTISDSSVESYTDSCDVVNPVNEETDYSILPDAAENQITFLRLTRQCFNYGRIGEPTKLTEKFVAISICIYSVLCLLLGLCAIYLVDDISHGRVYAILIPSIIGGLMIILLMAISSQPNSKRVLTFKVPLIPLIPATSILVNIYLMLCLDVSTWIRFGVWMAIGLPIYIYSAPHYKPLPVIIIKNPSPCTNLGYVNEDKKNSIQSLDSAYFEDTNEFGDRDEKSEYSYRNVDVVLADLDKILDKEEDDSSAYMVLANLDDMLSKSNTDDERKHSIDTISTLSNIGLEENVFVLVHREDDKVIATQNLLTHFASIESLPEEHISLEIEKQIEDITSVHEKQIEDITSVPEKQIEDNTSTDEKQIEDNTSVDEKQIEDNTSVDEKQIEDNTSIDEKQIEDNTSIDEKQIEDNTSIDEKQIEDNTFVEERHADLIEDIMPDATVSLKQNEILPEPTFVPPPPPPMPGLQIFKLPRVTSIKENKLRKVPKIPPVDYHQQISETLSDENETNDNVAFGSDQHNQIKEKLNKIIMKKAIGIVPPRKLTKPEAQKEEVVMLRQKSLNEVMNRIISEIPIRNEDNDVEVEVAVENEVIEEKQEKVADIKTKLNDLFKTDRRNALTAKAFRKVSKKKSVVVDNGIFSNKVNATEAVVGGSKTFPRASSEDKNQLDIDIHKNMLKSALSSIKFRKNERKSILDDTVPDINTKN